LIFLVAVERQYTVITIPKIVKIDVTIVETSEGETLSVTSPAVKETRVIIEPISVVLSRRFLDSFIGKKIKK